MRESFDGVLIAGAGPVGLTLAIHLGAEGVPVLVVEAGSEPSREARASTFHAATLELLDVLGLAAPLVEQGLIARTFQYRDREEGVIAELDMGVLAADTRFPYRLQLNQSALVSLILERLEEYPSVTVEFGTELVAADPAEGHVGIELLDTSGHRQTINSSYLVGADGAWSRVRTSLGIAFEGITYPERYLVAATSLDLLSLIGDLSYVNYVGDPEQWYVLLATPQGWRVLFPVPADVTDEDVTDEARVQELLRGVVDIGSPWPIQYKQLYRVHQRLASTFNQGRVCLAGDAAHINNPLGGMGMNSGIHDAVELSRSLAACVRDGHDPTILERYATRRRRVSSEHVNRRTDRNWSNLREGDPRIRDQQHAYWRSLKETPQREREYLREASMLTTMPSLDREARP